MLTWKMVSNITHPPKKNDVNHFVKFPLSFSRLVRRSLGEGGRRESRITTKAFTLIELSIVLVIIGLIVGGIVVGRSLIHQADLRKEVMQLNKYATAFNTFKLKYGCIPGDCANATTVLGATDSLGNAITNGNGNGLIDTGSGLCYDDSAPCGTDYWNTSPEMSGALQQLAFAGLIDFIPTTQANGIVGQGLPAVSMNPAAGFFIGANYNFTTCNDCRHPTMNKYQTGQNALWLVACNVNNSTTRIGFWDDDCGVFTANTLQAIDQKIDDGSPLTGHLFGFGGANTNSTCLSGSGITSTYNGSITNPPQCQAAFVIN